MDLVAMAKGMVVLPSAMAVVARIATVTVVERVMAAEVVRKWIVIRMVMARAREMAVLPHVKVVVDPIGTVIAEVVDLSAADEAVAQIVMAIAGIVADVDTFGI